MNRTPNHNLFSLTAAALATALIVCGCSHSGTHGDVQGTVTLDGRPVSAGSIRFRPAPGDKPTAGTTIKDGAYRARVPVGKVRVEISAPNLSAQKPLPANSSESLGGDVNYVMPTDLIPLQYNAQSTLTLDVEPGANSKDFDLKSH